MALVAPGPSKPGKLLLQYSSHLSLGATSPFLPLSPELALRGASASSSPSLRRRSLHHCHVWTLTGRRLERDGPRGDDSRVQSACTRHLPWRRARGARRCDANAARGQRLQQARDAAIGTIALDIIYEAAGAAANELSAEVAAEVMAGIAMGL